MQPESERTGPFPIFVPNARNPSVTDVLPGAAIVGFPLEADRSTIHVYFEGNRFASESMRRFADRVRLAAGRCRWFRLDIELWQREHPDRPIPATEYGYVSYPTSAQAFIDARELIEAAAYDDVLGIVTPINAELDRLLRVWIASDDPLEYFATGAVFDRRREAPRDDGRGPGPE